MSCSHHHPIPPHSRTHTSRPHEGGRVKGGEEAAKEISLVVLFVEVSF